MQSPTPPHVWGVLSKRLTSFKFSHAPDEPFPSDLDFINLINAIFEVRGAYTTLEDHIKHTHSNLTAKHQNRIVRLLPKKKQADIRFLFKTRVVGRRSWASLCSRR